LIDDLKSGRRSDRIEAARQLGRLGTDARPAARQLCKTLLDDDADVRHAVFDALGRIEPDLVEPLLTLVSDPNGYNHASAAGRLAGMERKAVPAIPVLVRDCELAVERYQVNSYFIAEEIRALGAISKTDPEVIATLIGFARHSWPTDAQTSQQAVRDVWLAVKEPAITTLGKISSTQGRQRRQVADCLVSELTQLERLTQRQALPDEWCVPVINALAAFGSDAKDAVPTLKALRLHSGMEVRTAALAALKRIRDD
jgi:HEAT repeat protein